MPISWRRTGHDCGQFFMAFIAVVVLAPILEVVAGLTTAASVTSTYDSKKEQLVWKEDFYGGFN